MSNTAKTVGRDRETKYWVVRKN